MGPIWNPLVVLEFSLVAASALVVAFLVFTPIGRKNQKPWLLIAAILFAGSAAALFIPQVDVVTKLSSGAVDEK